MSVSCGISHDWCTLKCLGEFYACAKFEEEPKKENAFALAHKNATGHSRKRG